MKKYSVFVFVCVLLSSCSYPPKMMVRTIIDLGNDIQADKIVIVSDVGKRFGEGFGEAFVQNMKTLTQPSQKDVSIMTFIEFIRSPYNEPDKKSTFPDTLFVFIAGRSSTSGQYGTYTVKYVMDVKYLDQEPFISQEIEVAVESVLWGSKTEGGVEFARTVFEELQERNIL